MLYKLSYGIDHALNDILIRIPTKPIIPKKVKGYSTALMFYPRTEGRLKEIQGVKKIQALKSFQHIEIKKKIGDICRFAKNGGKEVCDVILFNKDKQKLLADVRRVEQLLDIKLKKGN